MTLPTKPNLGLEWSTIYERLYDEVDTTHKWNQLNDAATTYMSRLLIGAMMISTTPEVFPTASTKDYTALKAKAQTIYDANEAANDVGTGANINQNLPSMTPTIGNICLAGGDPSSPQDLYVLTYAKRYMDFDIGTIPTTSQVWANWPIVAGSENWLATGYGRRYQRINEDGTGAFDGFAQNQMLTFTVWLLLTAEISNDTGFYTYAEGVLSGWKTKFPTLTLEKADGYYEASASYRTIKVLSLLILIHELWHLGNLNESEVSTYLSWMNERFEELRTTDFSNNDVLIEWLASEMLYAHLTNASSVPDSITEAAYTAIRDYINDTTLYGGSIYLLYRIWHHWNPSPRFTTLLRQIERYPQPRKFVIGGSPQMIVGGLEARVGCQRDTFERIVKQIEK